MLMPKGRGMAGAAAAAVAATAFALPAMALGPAEVFEKAAPGVWAVHGLDAQGKPLGFASAVVIASGKLVTSCRALAKAKKIELRREGEVHEATLEQADVERDLCVVSAPGLNAPAAALAAAPVKIGQKVYAIGVPARLDLALSEGIVSGTRSADASLPPLQTTAALSEGSSGGGLFDEQARLVGITTTNVARAGISANINFARPAAWIAEIGPRSAQQLAERRRRPANAQRPADGMPAPGTSWRYSFRDQQFGSPEQFYSVKAERIEGSEVRELFTVERGDVKEASVRAGQFAFTARPLNGGYTVLELAPYALDTLKDAGGSLAALYPQLKGVNWDLARARRGEERASVPAGTFSTITIQVTGTLPTFGVSSGDVGRPARLEYTVWYAPEVGRYVKIRHRLWNNAGRPVGDEVAQLVEFRPAPAPAAAAASAAGITTDDLEPLATPAGSAASAGAPRRREDALKAVVLNVSGSAVALASEDWGKLKAEWVQQVKNAASNKGAKFSTQEGEARGLEQPGTLVSIYVNDFKFVAPGARGALGILAGKAEVNARVRLLDLQTGSQIGEHSYKASSDDAPGIGVFAPASNKLLQDIAEQVVAEIGR
jgi:hypothetical protein